MNKDIEIGTTVYLKSGYNTSRRNMEVVETTITKVGRRYIEVEAGNGVRRGIKFDITNGLKQVTNYTPEWILYFSKEEIEEEQEYDKLKEICMKAFDRWEGKEFTIDQLRRIKAILEE